MNPRTIYQFWAVGGLLLLLSVTAWWLHPPRQQPSLPPPPAAATGKSPAPTTEPSRRLPGTAASSRNIVPSSPRGPADTPSHEQIIRQMDDAAVTYHVSALPVIKPYLRHADPEIRAAAVRNLITLGETDGAPLLRAASEQAATPQEAAVMLEAAEFLELPSGAPLLKHRFARKSPEAHPRRPNTAPVAHP